MHPMIDQGIYTFIVCLFCVYLLYIHIITPYILYLCIYLPAGVSVQNRYSLVRIKVQMQIQYCTVYSRAKRET
jgi:hypothetical protein